jgi:hypothetical protein
MRIFILLLLLLASFRVLALESIIEERALTFGRHEKKTISLRRHQIRGLEFFSIKTIDSQRVRGSRISDKEYSRLVQQYHLIAPADVGGQKSISLDLCQNLLQVVIQVPKAQVTSRRMCFERLNRDQRLALLNLSQAL